MQSTLRRSMSVNGVIKIDPVKLALYNNVDCTKNFTLEDIKQACEIMERISNEAENIMVGYRDDGCKSWWCPKCDINIRVEHTEICPNCQQKLNW